MENKPNYHALILSDKDKARLTKTTEGTIDFIGKNTRGLEEQAFVLRILMETFEETQNCVVPFKNRYTEPTWNYQKPFTG